MSLYNFLLHFGFLVFSLNGKLSCNFYPSFFAAVFLVDLNIFFLRFNDNFGDLTFWDFLCVKKIYTFVCWGK